MTFSASHSGFGTGLVLLGACNWNMQRFSDTSANLSVLARGKEEKYSSLALQ